MFNKIVFYFIVYLKYMIRRKKRYLIINNELIKTDINHPDEAKVNKDWIMKLFISDVEKSFFVKKTEGIKSIYTINIDNNEYFFSFDTTDSGGTDYIRKISIQFSSSDFKRHIKSERNVYVVNLFRPLDNNNKQISSERIWFLVDPLEIYNSTSVIDETWNDSSRWIDIRVIENMIFNSEKIAKNKKGNVLIARNEGIKEIFLDNNIKSRYFLMNKISNDVKNIVKEDDGSKEYIESYKKFRRIFRMILLENGKNNMINSSVKNNSLLIASHIHAVSDIKNNKNLSIKEKIEQIKDPDNGLLIPVGLDKLFDKYYITFDDDWKLIKSNEVTDEEVTELCGRVLDDAGPWIQGKNNNSLKYLKIHREKAFKKRTFTI